MRWGDGRGVWGEGEGEGRDDVPLRMRGRMYLCDEVPSHGEADRDDFGGGEPGGSGEVGGGGHG